MSKASKGQLKEGDVFKEGGNKVLISNFVEDEKQTFATILVFDRSGLVKDDCVAVERIYDMKFLCNINEIGSLL